MNKENKFGHLGILGNLKVAHISVKPIQFLKKNDIVLKKQQHIFQS